MPDEHFPDSFYRDCLENSWTDRIERFLVAQSVEKEAFHPVPRARGITKWSLFRVSRQSLQHQLALGRLDELDFGCSRPVRSVSLWPFRVSIRSGKKCPAVLST